MRSLTSIPGKILILLSTAAGFCGCGGGGEDNGAPEPRPVPVRAAEVESTTLRPTLEMVGLIEAIPEKTACVSARTNGTIEKILVVEGSRVKEGEELVRLDSRPAEAEVARAQAALDEKRAVLERLRRGRRPEEIEAARQEARKAQLKFEALRLKVRSMKELRDRGEVSEVSFETLKSSLAAAEAEFSAAKARLKLFEAGSRKEDIAAAEAQTAAAEAELKAKKLTLDYCRILSPLRGVVTGLEARLGRFVDPSVRLLSVVDTSRLFVRVRIPWPYASEVKPGARAVLNVPSVPGKTFEGKVARLSAQADPETGNIDAFCEVVNEDYSLAPGMSCRLVLSLPEIPGALVIPRRAVADRSGTPVVTVIRENKAYETEIAIGVKTKDSVQVLRGLKAGDLVAVEGGYGLPEGCAVVVVGEGEGEG